MKINNYNKIKHDFYIFYIDMYYIVDIKYISFYKILCKILF